MRYALDLPAVYQVCGPGSSGALVLALAQAFVDAGWTATAITGGWRLRTHNKQALEVYVDLWDNGTSISLQLSSTSTAAVGYEHKLAPGRVYQICACASGFFISSPGLAADPGGSAVCGGIPYLAKTSDMGDQSLGINEVWFSFGDAYGSPFAYAENPRVNLDTDLGNANGGGWQWNQVGCVNGVVHPLPDYTFSVPQILRRSSLAPDQGNKAMDSHPLWNGEIPIWYPAFVGWGDESNSQIRVRGQIYNAVVISATAAMDTVASWDNGTWMAYTHNYFWGTLWLLKGVASGGISNHAY